MKTENRHAQQHSNVSEWLFKNGRLIVIFCWTQERNNGAYGVGNGVSKMTRLHEQAKFFAAPGYSGYVQNVQAPLYGLFLIVGFRV
jgi:hypothetical protein